MNNLRNLSLFIVVVLWATLIGAIVYSHVVFLSAYLHHLPASTNLIRGPYGIHDERFWTVIHPILIVALLTATLLNRKLKERRKFMLFAVGIYVLVLAVTFTYFVPELMAFADSANSNLTTEEWLQRGIKWERLSWIRGCFMYLGFVFLLIALIKSKTETVAMRLQQKRRQAEHV